MEVILGCCAGLDLHKDSVEACVRRMSAGGKVGHEVRHWGTTTRELVAMAEWLGSAGVTHVAMESTGVYVETTKTWPLSAKKWPKLNAFNLGTRKISPKTDSEQKLAEFSEFKRNEADKAISPSHVSGAKCGCPTAKCALRTFVGRLSPRKCA